MRHIRPMLARDPNEGHRAATPLELLFDLVAVIAIAVAAHGLRHAIGHGDVLQGLIGYAFAFLIIWWPWNQFTWFASSFDNDDALYRLKVMLLMFGAMFVAASMSVFFDGGTLVYAWAGYVLMRISQILMWARVIRFNPEFRQTAQLHIVGLVLLQIYWAGVVFVLPPEGVRFEVLFLLGFALELAMPWFAERGKATPWHAHHLIERFGLLIIIVLGEILLSGVEALRLGVEGGFTSADLTISICGIILTFAMWWYYFYEPATDKQFTFNRAFVWGYGHMLIFASAAAVGAGLGILLDALHHAAEPVQHAALAFSAVSSDVAHSGPAFDVGLAGQLTVSISIGVYLVSLWLVRDRHQCQPVTASVLLVLAILTAVSGLLPHGLIATTVLLVGCVVFRIASVDRRKQVEADSH